MHQKQIPKGAAPEVCQWQYIYLFVYYSVMYNEG